MTLIIAYTQEQSTALPPKDEVSDVTGTITKKKNGDPSLLTLQLVDNVRTF